MFSSMPHSFDDIGTLAGVANAPVRVRGQRAWPASHVRSSLKTPQPPRKSSTRAAVIPTRPCWLSLSIYVKRLTLAVGLISTPAFVGVWEDEQQLELKPCCLLPPTAILVPESLDLVSSELSYGIFWDFMKIPEPQPRSFDPWAMTHLSGFTGVGRRNLQG